MKRKNIIKFLTFVMVLVLFPTMDIGEFYQGAEDADFKSVPLEKMLSSQGVSAATNTLLNSKSGSSSNNNFNGKSVSQPSRTPLPQNSVKDAIAPKDFGWQQSIGTLTLPDNQVTAVQNGMVIGSYPATDEGVQEALYTMYSATDASTSDFVIYYGANLTLSKSVVKSVVSNPNATNMTFSTLNGHAKSLTWVTNPADSLTSSNSSQASGTNYVITIPEQTYFGVSTVFRNATLATNSVKGCYIYAQGNAFATTNGSWSTAALEIYGGTDNTDIIGDTNVYIGATGSAAG